jgi:hypothetical protein
MQHSQYKAIGRFLQRWFGGERKDAVYDKTTQRVDHIRICNTSHIPRIHIPMRATEGYTSDTRSCDLLLNNTATVAQFYIRNTLAGLPDVGCLRHN